MHAACSRAGGSQWLASLRPGLACAGAAFGSRNPFGGVLLRSVPEKAAIVVVALHDHAAQEQHPPGLAQQFDLRLDRLGRSPRRR